MALKKGTPTINDSHHQIILLASHGFIQFLLPVVTVSVPEGIDLLITYQ